MAATFPESHGAAFGLALGLGLGGLDHGIDVAFEDFRLEDVEHAAQVLEHHDLASPLLRGGGNREAAGLHGAGHLFAGGGQHLAQQLDHTLVCADRFLFGIQGGFVPGGVLRADGVFAEFSRAIQLLSPFLHLVRDGMGGLLGQTHMRGRMRGQDGDLCEILDGLVCGHTPFLADAVQVAQIAGQAGAYAHQFVGDLVETRSRDAGLETDCGYQLTVDCRIGAVIGDVQQLAAHLVGRDRLHETALLVGDARHVQHAVSAHHATGGDCRGLFGRVAADRAVHENRMPGCGQLRRVSDGVVNVANLVFAMGIGVERTVFGNLRVFQRVRGFLVPGERVQDGVACRALGQLVDDLATFHQHLRGRVHEAAEDDVTFDFEIGENAGRARCDGREHRGRFGGAAFVIRTIEELGLVQCHVVFTHHGGEGRVQTHSSGERDDGAVLDVAAFLAHFDRIHEHRHLVAFPNGHADHQGEFADSADTAFRVTVVEHAFHTPARGAQHAVVSEQRVQGDVSFGEQLRDARWVRMRQVKLGAQLRHILKRGWCQTKAILLTPSADTVQRGGRLFVFAHIPTHFPTALRYSSYPGLCAKAASMSWLPNAPNHAYRSSYRDGFMARNGNSSG